MHHLNLNLDNYKEKTGLLYLGKYTNIASNCTCSPIQLDEYGCDCDDGYYWCEYNNHHHCFEEFFDENYLSKSSIIIDKQQHINMIHFIRDFSQPIKKYSLIVKKKTSSGKLVKIAFNRNIQETINLKQLFSINNKTIAVVVLEDKNTYNCIKSLSKVY